MRIPVGVNALHGIALVIAGLNTVSFIFFNYRGILGWEGIGVYTVPVYVVVVLFACVIWMLAQLRSRTGRIFFWTIVFTPFVLMLLLPMKFYV